MEQQNESSKRVSVRNGPKPATPMNTLLVGGLKERQDFPVLFSSEVGADAHVKSDDFPLGITIGAGGAEVVAMVAILRPQCGASSNVGLGSSRSRSLRGHCGASSDDEDYGRKHEGSGDECAGRKEMVFHRWFTF
jgi:hypothetical protein